MKPMKSSLVKGFWRKLRAPDVRHS
jgi:hypothetical protein